MNEINRKSVVRPHFESENCARTLSDILEARLLRHSVRMAKVVFNYLVYKVRRRSFSEAFNTKAFVHVPMSISSKQGKFLYQMARIRKPKTIVEFGTSFGVSAIYLASALKDQGSGRLVTTEIEAEKISMATENLRRADLLDWVEIRKGNALETLKDGPDQIDFLFLDGWKDLYLPIFKLLSDRLPVGSIIISDNVNSFPREIGPFFEAVNSGQHGQYVSEIIPMGDGFMLATRIA